MGAGMTAENEKCFAYLDRGGLLDLDSIADSVERVRDKMFAAGKQWLFYYDDRELLLLHGKIVEIVILIAPEIHAV